MDNTKLINIARSLSNKLILSKVATSGGVGSALIAKNGRIYKGKSIDCSCGIGFCAEASAISSMLSENESEIDKIVAVNRKGKILPPCGRCREMICQINKKNINTEVIVSKNKTVKLSVLLPYLWMDYDD